MNVTDDPVQRFQLLWEQARQSSVLQQKNAVCISTIDAQGFPQARFVDLKRADASGFVFCTDYQSAKGQQLLDNPKTALTVWWEHLSVQVRITGTAAPIHDTDAHTFWLSRSRAAQLTTLVSRQSQPLQNCDEWQRQLADLALQYKNTNIPKPKNWGGFSIKPMRIEFLQFKEDRMHVRDLYERKENHWSKTHLQP